GLGCAPGGSRCLPCALGLRRDDVCRVAWRTGPMSQSTAPSERCRPPRRRLLRALAVAARILVIRVFGVAGNRFRGASRELAAALAETDRLDPGWRFEDLEAQRQLPPDRDNAALQVIAVGSSLQRYWNYQPNYDSVSATDVLRGLPPEK